MSNSKSPSSSKDGSEVPMDLSRHRQGTTLLLWVDWVPVSESNLRDWKARHRRSVAAKEAWGVAAIEVSLSGIFGARMDAIRLSLSDSSASAPSFSTTTISSEDANH